MAYTAKEVGWNPKYPLYTPAISMMYVRHLGRKYGRDSGHMFPDVEELNWYDPNNQYFTHPGALYSAGHAYLEIPELERKLEVLLAQKPKDEIIVELNAVNGFLAEHDLKEFFKLSAKPLKPKSKDAERLNELRDGLSEEISTYLDYKINLEATLSEITKLEKMVAREKIITRRDREKTIFVADSGGYQIGRGVLKFEGELHGPSADKLRFDILHWLEEYSDYSMIIDFPAWAVGKNGKGGKKGFILESFEECLQETMYNCDFIQKHRVPGKIKFLNVVQGRNYTEAKQWYDAVKHYDFEGWSFAGPVAGDPAITVKLILNLWKDGLLNENKSWLHILGKSRLDAVWTNNIIHRCIQKYVCPTIQVSYDSASAYLMAAYGQIWHNHQIDHREMKFLPTASPNDRAMAQCDAMFPWVNKLTKDLPMKKFCMELSKIILNRDEYDPVFYESLEKNIKTSEIDVTDSQINETIENGEIVYTSIGLDNEFVNKSKIEANQYIIASPENIRMLEEYGAKQVETPTEMVGKTFRVAKSNNFIDSHAYAILMYHNTIIQMRAIEAINKISEFPVESLRGRIPSIHIEFKERVEELFYMISKDTSILTDDFIENFNEHPRFKHLSLTKFKNLIDGEGSGGMGFVDALFGGLSADDESIKAREEYKNQTRPSKKKSFKESITSNKIDADLFDAPEFEAHDKKMEAFVDARGGSGKQSHIKQIKESMKIGG